MTSPQRRHDPQPIGQGWEVAVAVIGGALLCFGLAALCGLGGASALFGGGWVWPHGTDTIGHVIGGLCAGHPGRGLDPRQEGLVAEPTAVYMCVGVCELAVIAMSIVGCVLVTRYRRPNDARGGMATRGDAAEVLGLTRLRSARHIIRPDLYPANARSRTRGVRRRGG